MDELRGWLDKQLEDRLVEPNSSLGQALAYMQNHWENLTRFLQIAGAPLDNNLVEVRFVGQKPSILKARGIGPRFSKKVFEEPEHLIPVSV